MEQTIHMGGFCLRIIRPDRPRRLVIREQEDNIRRLTGNERAPQEASHHRGRRKTPEDTGTKDSQGIRWLHNSLKKRLLFWQLRAREATLKKLEMIPDKIQ